MVRMGTSRLTRLHWLVYFHYLIGINGRIKYTKETHRMILADYEDYVNAFNLAGYRQIKFLGENEWTRSRGLFKSLKVQLPSRKKTELDVPDQRTVPNEQS